MDGEGYSLKEAAKLANCSVKTLRNHIKSGKLPARVRKGKHGDEYRITPKDLEVYLGKRVETDSRDLARLEGVTATVATQQAIQQAVFTAVQPISAKIDSLTNTLETMEKKRLEELEALRQELAATRELLENQEQERRMAEAERDRLLEQRDRRLVEEMRRLLQEKKRSWWKFWWR